MEERGSAVAVRGEVGTRRGPSIAVGKAVTWPDFELEELRAMAVGEKYPAVDSSGEAAAETRGGGGCGAVDRT
jgi:hypothetical protein